MKKNYEQIFVNEMNDWTSDEKDWIPNRNYKLFNECFEVQYRHTILDMEDEMIRKL